MATAYDVVVIGGGPGGYVAAIRAAQLKMKVAVVERERLGGICLNWGCIPTKALLKNAEVFDKFKHGAEWGIKADNVSFDFNAIIKRSRGVADRMSSGIDFLMKKNRVTPHLGTATITAPGKIEVAKKDGSKEVLEAKHIIVATGARPRTIPGVALDGEKVITSKEAMSLAEHPESLIVIGAGAIGIEFTYFYSVLGTKVTVLEAKDTILPVEDKEISRVVHNSLKHRGVTLVTGAMVNEVKTTGKGVSVTYTVGSDKKTIEAPKALMAIGVQGNVENLGIEKLGVAIERAHIKVDSHYRTNVPGIYAIGDVVGPPWLAHVASAEGIHCVEAIAGLGPHEVDYSNIPGCTYCQPQVASVGKTEEQLKAEGVEYRVGRFPFTASGKAVAASEAEGMVKLLFGKKYGELIGAHIVGSEATEMIAELCLGKALEVTWEELHHTMHAHPTLSEAIMEAAANSEGLAIHI
ncbi:MAG: dihydrolipoyl dehydrogenase [Candidatus Sumerlaeia bacterium]|nr:dihydrolipoyl dehydrogenase [Candidatus Sumerlaeia bacterium]